MLKEDSMESAEFTHFFLSPKTDDKNIETFDEKIEQLTQER